MLEVHNLEVILLTSNYLHCSVAQSFKEIKVVKAVVILFACMFADIPVLFKIGQ